MCNRIKRIYPHLYCPLSYRIFTASISAIKFKCSYLLIFSKNELAIAEWDSNTWVRICECTDMCRSIIIFINFIAIWIVLTAMLIISGRMLILLCDFGGSFV